MVGILFFSLIEKGSNSTPNRSIKTVFVLLIYVLFSTNLFADKNNNTLPASSESWTDASSWDEGIAPPIFNIGGEHITINGYVTVLSEDINSVGGVMTFSAANDVYNLTINNGGLLVIEGDVNFANKAMNLIINSGGRVLILGNFTSTNKINVSNDGVFAITGDMDFGGAQSVYVNPGSGNLYVGDLVSGNTDAENEDQSIAALNDGSGHDDLFLYNLIHGNLSGISIVLTSGSTVTTENGGFDTFGVVLDAQPTSDVVINMASSNLNEFTIDQPLLTFTNSNWNVEQTVTVTGMDDAIDDGDFTGSVQLSIDDAISDDTYDALDDVFVTVTNVDDDTSGISVSAISDQTAEDGTMATFTIVLDSEPLGDVVIPVSSDDITEGTVSPSTLTFTATDWSIAQIVTVTGLDDTVDDGDVDFNVILSEANSTDPNYDGLDPTDVAVTNTDDDTSGISVSVISGQTAEDGTTATFTVVMDSEPLGDVVIPVSSDDTTEGTVSPSTLTFTATDWSIAQIITLTGVDDAVDDGNVDFNVILSVASSTDPNYNGLDPTDVAVTNTDDDTSGISVSVISGQTAEDGTMAIFTVVLDSEPLGDVVIPVSSDDTTEGTVSLSTLTFTATDWAIAQIVTVTGLDDTVDDGDVDFNVILSVANSTDPKYDGLDPTDVAVTNTDDDTSGISVSAISGQTAEDGTTAIFTVVLDSEPLGDVLIPVSSDDTTEGTVSPSTLTFTATDWSIAQIVTLTGVDDAVDDGDVDFNVILFAASSTDPNYDGLDPTDVAVTNTDDDTSGISVSVISGQTAEDGTTATFTVVLDSEPLGDVFIPVSSDDTTEGTVSPSTLTFTATDWSIAQIVTVTGVDDGVDDGDVDFNVILSAASSSDPNYDGLDPVDVVVTNVDDDEVGNFIPVITGQTTALQTDEDNSLMLSLDDLLVMDTDNLFPEDFALFLLGGNDYAVDGMIVIPAENYFGALTVPVYVNDGQDDSNIYDVIIEVLPVNDPPEAQPYFFETDETYSDSLEGLVSDPEEDELIFSTIPIIAPQGGEINIHPTGEFEYIPTPGFEGSDSFEYEVCDGGLPSLCASAVVTINVFDNQIIEVVNHVLSRSSPYPHDRMQFDKIEDYPNNSVTIFNRWGNLVWKIEGYNNADKAFFGSGDNSGIFGSGGPLPVGTYYYIVDLGDGSPLAKGFIRVE